jgi:uncharacterized membrane protein
MNAIRHFLLKPWLYILIVLIGTFLKFYHLNSKFFFHDEIATILYTSGIKVQTIRESIPTNQIKSFGYYDSLIHLSTKPYSLKSQVSGIFSDTHLTPAHYVFLTGWYRLMGDNNTDYRLFSVFVFILSLPLFFLLTKTLFYSNLAGWIAVSLYAVSPFIHFQAQEARYNILWVCFFILSNYLFLQAIKQNRVIWWIVYVVASILALYTSAFSGLFIFGQLVYILLFKKELRLIFFVSLLLIFLAYLPWMYFLYTVRNAIESGLAWHKTLHSSFYSLDLLFFQLLGFARSVAFLFDFSLYFQWFKGVAASEIYSALLIDLILLTFIFYSIFHLFTKAAKEIRWFVILIIMPLFLLLYISDLVRNGFASVLWRYQIVNMAGITLIITNLLKDKIVEGKWSFIGIYFGVVLLGIASIFKIDGNRCWMGRLDCGPNIEAAQLISNAAHPLIITDFGDWGFTNFLGILNDSKAMKADIMYSKGKIAGIKETIMGKGYSDLYVIEASDTLTQQIQSQFGERMLPLRKEVNRYTHQIWQIKF